MKGISVILPVFNREKYIGEAIQSIIEQNYDGDIEIIISDDGSTDRSLEIAASFGSKIRILQKPKSCLSQGVSGTRNRAIEAATQPYIAFLDSDDFYLPNHLNRMATVLEQHPKAGFVFARLLEMKECEAESFCRPWTKGRVSKRNERYAAVSGHLLHTNTLLIRREVFREVGHFDERLRNREDSDLWMRINEKYRGVFADHCGAVYRVEHDVAQLTSAVHMKEINYCTVLLYRKALQRYKACATQDQYLHFILGFKIALAKRSHKRKISRFIYSMLSLVHRHPFWVVVHSIEIMRDAMIGKRNAEWKEYTRRDGGDK